VPPQPETNAAGVIGSIAAQVAWALTWATTPPPDAHTVCHGLELGRLVGLPWQRADAKRETLAITHEVQLGAKSTFGAT
jgi:hypothetical protein